MRMRALGHTTTLSRTVLAASLFLLIPCAAHAQTIIDDGILSVPHGIGWRQRLVLRSGRNLLVCEGDNGRLASIDSQKRTAVLADTYDGNSFNEPNVLRIDPWGACISPTRSSSGTRSCRLASVARRSRL